MTFVVTQSVYLLAGKLEFKFRYTCAMQVAFNVDQLSAKPNPQSGPGAVFL